MSSTGKKVKIRPKNSGGFGVEDHEKTPARKALFRPKFYGADKGSRTLLFSLGS